MNTSILLMSGGAVVVLVLLLVLAVGGGATYLIVREKKRKEKARERAAERRRARDEALQRARSGMPDAFTVPEEKPSVSPSTQQDLSESQKLQRLEARKADLNTLRLVRENGADAEMADTASRRFSTSRIGKASEEKKEEASKDKTASAAAGVAAGSRRRINCFLHGSAISFRNHFSCSSYGKVSWPNDPARVTGSIRQS